MRLGEIIMKYRKEHAMSQRQFAALCDGVSNGYISMIENDRNPSTGKPIIPSLDKLGVIAGAMGMTLHELLSIADDMPVDVSPKATSSISRANPRPIRVPVLGTIPAGIPLEAIEDVQGWEEIPSGMGRGGKEYIGLKVSGDSMSPVYLDGDVLILRVQDTCESGQDCAVMVNGEDATFKRVRLSPSGITLQPLNPAYAPMSYTNQEVNDLPVRILGVVVELRRKI